MSEICERKKGLREQRVGVELMLIDEVADQVHVLNPTSAYIWTCLGETSDHEAIARKVCEHFETAGKDVPAVVATALAQFREKGLTVAATGR